MRGIAGFQDFPAVILHIAENFSPLEKIARLFFRIPESCVFGVLKNQLIYIQRIIGSVLLLRLINSQLDQKVINIPFIRVDLLPGAAALSAPLQQNRGNAAGRRVVIRTAPADTGTHHVGDVHLPRHFPGLLHHSRVCLPGVVHMRRKTLEHAAAVEIQHIIHSRKALGDNRIRMSLHRCSVRFSRKNKVEIL